MNDLELAKYGTYNSDAGKMRLQASLFSKFSREWPVTILSLAPPAHMYMTCIPIKGGHPHTVEGFTLTNGVCSPVVFTQRIGLRFMNHFNFKVVRAVFPIKRYLLVFGVALLSQF